MCFSGGSSGGDGGAQAQADAKQAQIAQGQDSIDQNFSGFNDTFYNGIADAYRQYAGPQFNRQAGDAEAQLGYGLDRAGLQNSTAAAKQQGDLSYNEGQQAQNIEESAAQAANAQRTTVDNARSSLVSELNADGNAGAAATGAAARAQTLALRPTFSPIGSLFQNTTAGLSSYGQGSGLLSTSNGNVGSYAPGSAGYAPNPQSPQLYQPSGGASSYKAG